MSLGALALAAALAAGPEGVELDEDEEHQRAVRIGATALGGALGIAAPLLLGFAWQWADGPCVFGPCDLPHMVMAGALPLTAAVGLSVPHRLLGGRAGIGFGLFGGLIGYLTAAATLGLLSVAMASSPTDGNADWAATAPAAGGGFIAALSLTGAIIGLELRHAELRAGAKGWPLGRSLAEGAAYVLPLALTEAVLSFLSAGFSGLGAVLLLFGTAANIALSTLAAWGVHRTMGGKGGAGPAVVAALLAAAAATVFLAVHIHGPPERGIFSGSLLPIPLLLITAAIASVGPSAGLEWSHARKTADYDTAASSVDLQLQGGLAPGGGAMFGLSGTF